MAVILLDASARQSVIEHLNQLYLYDFSEFGSRDVGPEGLYDASYLDGFWSRQDRHPFLLGVDGQHAGFALVSTPEDSAHSIQEFFVMRKYRRRGIGASAATQLFDMYPGEWKVHQFASNVAAREFWRGVINAYTSGRFTETAHGGAEGWTQFFDNRPE